LRSGRKRRCLWQNFQNFADLRIAQNDFWTFWITLWNGRKYKVGGKSWDDWKDVSDKVNFFNVDFEPCERFWERKALVFGLYLASRAKKTHLIETHSLTIQLIRKKKANKEMSQARLGPNKNWKAIQDYWNNISSKSF